MADDVQDDNSFRVTPEELAQYRADRGEPAIVDEPRADLIDTRQFSAPVPPPIDVPAAPRSAIPPMAPGRSMPQMPGGAPDAYWGNFNRAYRDLPLKDAEMAIGAATRYQGTRGYQRDIANGVPADTALAKWAPMMFSTAKGSQLSGAAAMVKNMRPQAAFSFVPGTNGAPASYQAPGQRPVIVPPNSLPRPDAVLETKKDPVSGHTFYKKGGQWVQLNTPPKDPSARVSLDPETGKPKTISGVVGDPYIRERMGTNAPGYIAPPAAPAAPGFFQRMFGRGTPAPAPVVAPVVAAPPAQQPLGKSEVVRHTKDGRAAIFDAATKKFVRYANDQPDSGE